MTTPMQGHTQLKVKCLSCSLHFIILTWHPEQHATTTIHCPECGRQGVDACFIIWSEPSTKQIYEVVPGSSQMTGMSLT